MAKFFPDFKDIKTLKQKPTAGEYHALEILKDFPNEYEVYFQPYINGYNPDIIIVRKNYGVLIIEVKDWQLVHYHIDENDHWSLKKDGTPIRSPIKQVKDYKDNLFDFSIPSMLHEKIKDKNSYGIVQVAVYFHNETSNSIREKSIKQDDFYPVFGRDNFNINDLMSHRHIIRKYKNNLFKDETYEEFQRILKPSYHTLEQAKEIELDPKQKALAISREKQQKIRGVAGSGKTLILAQRAVNSHIRHGGKVLILTYNITLRNYIHDNLNRVREDFNWNNFHINHYHGFMASEANNNNIEITNLADYDNEKIFEAVKDQLYKYQAIFIDEIQDYRESWIKIIKKYFLADQGEFVVFGDEKQNIYDITLDNERKPYTGIGGAWLKLDKSHRLSNKILDLAEAFQDYFFEKKYELDKAIPKQLTIDYKEESCEKESIEYHKLDDSISLTDLSDFIISKLKINSIQPQDVCILAQSNGLLRALDFEIRKIQKQKTYTTFETQEMYDSLLKKNLSESDLKSEIRTIQKNKRFNFWMNSPGLKLSTINSFKGWEINTLFLIIDGESNFESNEKIYTAITRCRCRLFILNIGHADYDIFFKENIKLVESPSKNITESSKSTDVEKSNKSNENKLEISKRYKKKTIRETIEEDSISTFRSNFAQLKTNGKFMILILGEISENKNIFQEALNNHFSKFNIRPNEWDIDLWNNKKIKNKSLKSLKIGQSKYSLIVTAQIHHHSSKGNKEQNLLIELNEMHYIDMVYGCKPQSLLSVENFVDKIDEYISKVQ